MYNEDCDTCTYAWCCGGCYCCKPEPRPSQPVTFSKLVWTDEEFALWLETQFPPIQPFGYEMTDEIKLDLALYGVAFTDAETGERIDPTTVVICGCKQAPWLPPCVHKDIPPCPMAPYDHERD